MKIGSHIELSLVFYTMSCFMLFKKKKREIILRTIPTDTIRPLISYIHCKIIAASRFGKQFWQTYISAGTKEALGSHVDMFANTSYNQVLPVSSRSLACLDTGISVTGQDLSLCKMLIKAI